MDSQDDRSRGKRAWKLKALTWTIAIIPVIAVTAHRLWAWAEGRELTREIESLRAAGEPMSIEELTPPHLPDSGNASLDYKAAGKLIDTNLAPWKKQENSDSSKGEFQFPFTPDEITTIDAIIAANQLCLNMVARARSKVPGDWGDQFTRPYMFSNAKFDLNSERTLAILLRLAVFAAHTDGHDGEAIEYLSDLLRLRDSALKRPTLVAHLVALGIDAITSDTAWKIAPNLQIGTTGADLKVVLDLIKRLEDERMTQDGQRLSWRSERICMLDAYQSIADGTFSWNQPNAPRNNTTPTTAYVASPLFLGDARLMLLHVQGIMQAADAPDWPSAKQRLPVDLPNAIQAHPALHMISAMLVPSLAHAVRLDYRGDSERHLAIAALAIRLYEVDHDGRLPGKLEDLVPSYLPAVPTDPLSGGSILYKADPALPRIYSVGEDGVDDGGVEEHVVFSGPASTTKGDIVANLKAQPRPVDRESN